MEQVFIKFGERQIVVLVNVSDVILQHEWTIKNKVYDLKWIWYRSNKDIENEVRILLDSYGIEAEVKIIK